MIADGHHRYETALAFRNENPDCPARVRVMMTFVNMHSPGLRILATHRLVSGLPADWETNFFEAVRANFEVTEIPSIDALKQAWSSTATGVSSALAIGAKLYILEARAAAGELDVASCINACSAMPWASARSRPRRAVPALHARHRRRDRACPPWATSRSAFLLKPTSVQQVADTSFAGGVMPQKSTDFYPKLLSGLTIYKVD